MQRLIPRPHSSRHMIDGPDDGPPVESLGRMYLKTSYIEQQAQTAAFTSPASDSACIPPSAVYLTLNLICRTGPNLAALGLLNEGETEIIIRKVQR